MGVVAAACGASAANDADAPLADAATQPTATIDANAASADDANFAPETAIATPPWPDASDEDSAPPVPNTDAASAPPVDSEHDRDAGSDDVAHGTVVEAVSGYPLVGWTVRMGAFETVTTAQGSFEVRAPAGPYDLVISDPDGAAITVHQDLTRRDPMVVHHAASLPLAANLARIAGELSGGGPYPLGPRDVVRMVFLAEETSDVALLGGTFPPLGPDYSLLARWSGEPAITGQVLAWGRFDNSDSTPPGSVQTTWWVEAPLTVRALESVTQDLTLSPLAHDRVAGTVELPPDVRLTQRQLYYRVGSGGTVLPIADIVNPAQPGAFDDPIPVLKRPDARLCAAAICNNRSSGFLLAERCGIAAGATTVQLAPRTAPAATSLPPTMNEGTALSLAPYEAGIHLLAFATDLPTREVPNVTVYTNRNAVTWPELSGGRVAMPKGQAYQVTVAGVAPFADTDEASGPHGLAVPGRELTYLSRSPIVTVSTAP